MRKSVPTMLMILVIFFIALTVAHANPPAEGETLPDIILPVPQDDQQRQYLGITTATEGFKIPQIKSEVVIIEIFSMY
jgi:hypothetical protein